MKTGTGALIDRPSEKGTCRHHWIIEPPNGPVSKGVCKLCGEVKMFDNILADLMLNNDSSVPFVPKRVTGIEFEVEDN